MSSGGAHLVRVRVGLENLTQPCPYPYPYPDPNPGPYSPEPLQLEPEHTLAEECSGVKLGLAAAEVTVGVIQLCAAATPTVAPAYPVAAGLSSGGWIYSNPALLQGDHPVGVRPGSR